MGHPVLEDDELPNFICASCLEYVNKWVTFRNLCLANHERLFRVLCAEPEVIVRNVEEPPFSCEYKNNEKRKESVIVSLPYSVYETVINRPTVKILSNIIIRLPNSVNANKVLIPPPDLTKETVDEEVIEEQLEEIFDKVHLDERYKCELCSLPFNEICEYLDHQETHDGDLIFKCDQCCEVFYSRKELVEHDSNHKIPCKKCGSYVSRNNMKKHLIKHTTKYKCKHCPASFSSKVPLDLHITAVHTKRRDYTCDQCQKSFSTKAGLVDHVKTHSESKEYRCDLCSYACRTSSNLYSHKAKHKLETYLCECSKTFASAQHIKNHIRMTHSRMKNGKLTCPFCSLGFSLRPRFREHLFLHTSVHFFKCTTCDKSFIREEGLKEHMLSHVVEEKTQGACGETFLAVEAPMHMCGI